MDDIVCSSKRQQIWIQNNNFWWERNLLQEKSLFLEESHEEEKMGFPLIIEEIFKLLLANKFPRK